ncbi:FAD-binding oxidoreductase [Photobacterium sagamiensis]|uniref:FAD-binding oxidoreductase n=1 Tax=Photobacterium sagamiensis TaxID=2910241 RepID=UPI003D0A01BF
MSSRDISQRRWNGWGQAGQEMALTADGAHFLRQTLGDGQPLASADWEQVMAQVPESRLPPSGLYSIKCEDRIRHARGQSLPDWLAMKSGDFTIFPDAVAFPTCSEQVRQLLAQAKQNGWDLIPYGGGTSVVGHINTHRSERPVLTVSMVKMNRLLDLDRDDQIATFGAGVAGPFLEAQLQAHGYTLGHFPQSFELSTLGGWIVTRSSGQQSLRYGRIENLFAGGKLETFNGTINIPTVPASSAGPDWRQLLLGSEGRLGILSEAKVKVSRLPQQEIFGVAFLPNWPQGMRCVRELIQQKLPLSMLRLSNSEETRTQLFLSATATQRQWLSRLMALKGIGDNKTMMVYGITGNRLSNRSVYRELKQTIRHFGGFNTGQPLGKKWAHKRFTFPYLRETLWQRGYVVDTLETATNWSNIPSLIEKIEHNLRHGLEKFGEKVHVFTHLSHLYSDGGSIYTTYVFRVADSYQETHQRWQTLKHSTSQIIVDNQATISHQHGVGLDHAPYLEQEKSELVIASLKRSFEFFDPEKQLNPGKLFNDLE